MVGLPASGKSTRAKEIIEKNGNTVRINKDLLRTMLHFDKFNFSNEDKTRTAAQQLAIHFLSSGINVIIDDTNLNEKTLESWKMVAKLEDAKIEYCDLTDVSVGECLSRDRHREKKVGNSVIQKMALQHLDYRKGDKVVICDLDGTLCDIEHRLQYAKGETKDWGKFFSLISEDTLRQDVKDKFLPVSGHDLILVSARPEDYRGATEDWLEKNGIYYSLLIMRESNDKRDDTEVKKQIYDKYLKNLDIVRVIDDRPKVVRMWRELGLTVEDVGKGIEF